MAEETSTHITRIYGTNKNGDILSDIWVDVERIHHMVLNTETRETIGQKVHKYINWCDDPGHKDYVPESDDGYVVRKICRPDETDLNDPEEWVPVRVMAQTRFDESGMTQRQAFRTAEAISPDVRRIVHYDTNLDDIAKTWPDIEGHRSYVMTSDEYKPDRKTKDEGQYIEHYITNSFQVDAASEYDRSTGLDQQIKIYLRTRHSLIDDEADPAPDAKLEDKKGEDDVNPPYVLDPYQAIINVQLGGVQDFLIGGLNFITTSVDGVSFNSTTIPGGDEVTSAAYHGGVWLVMTAEPAIYRSTDSENFKWERVHSGDPSTSGRGWRNFYVAAGKPDGAKQAVFVSAFSTNTPFTGGSRSTFNSDATFDIMISTDKGMTWSNVKSYTGHRIQFLSFVNGKFFIGGAHNTAGPYGAGSIGIAGGVWMSQNPDKGFLVVSEDGENWSESSGLGTSVAIEDPPPGGGYYCVPSVCGVAYGAVIDASGNKQDRYVAIVQQPFDFPDPIHGLQDMTSHFTSYTSSNGKNWGLGGSLVSDTIRTTQLSMGQPTVTFGDSTFVTLGHRQMQTSGEGGGQGWIRMNPEIMDSPDGSGWGVRAVVFPNSDSALPLGASSWGATNYSKTAQCFLAGGVGMASAPQQAAVLMSKDGSGWSTVYTPSSNTRLAFIAVGRLPSAYRGKK